MSPGRRLLLFALLTTAVIAAALWGTRESLRTRESAQEAGLRWLKAEYQLDDATFERISRLHQDYFVQCGQMCRALGNADRPLLWRTRQRSRQPADLESRLAKERSLCTECEQAAMEHLRRVAALLPSGQGERFLDDMLPTLQQQRRDHDRSISSSLRR